MAVIPDDVHINYQLQFRRCGKPCKTCAETDGHGPYWYAFWRDSKHRMRSSYVGKQRPTSVTTAQGGELPEEVSSALVLIGT